jgi:hypothetical protein
MSALTTPQTSALAQLRAWVEKVFAETISDNRLKASLVSEALEQYGIASATLARAMGLDAASLAAFLAQRIAPGEVFEMETEYGIRSAPYLQFSKVRRQLNAEKAALGIQYSGAMGDEWLTNHLAVILINNGLQSAMDLSPVFATVDIRAGDPLRRGADDWGRLTGQYFYDVKAEDPGQGFITLYSVAVDPSNVTEYASGDGSAEPHAAQSQRVTSDHLLYYANAKTGQRIDYFSQFPGDTIAEDKTGEGTTYYRVKFTDDGIPIYFSSFAPHESFFAQIAPVLSILAMAAGFAGVSQLIGNAVMGANAAAYPSLANTIGKVIMSTALSGGDVAKAALNALGGYAGQALGGIVDSAAFGEIAGAAITAAATGGNVGLSVAQTAASLGIKQMDDFFTDDPGFDPALDVSFDPGAEISMPGEWGTLADLGINANAFEFSDWLSANEGAFINVGFDVDSIAVDAGGNLYLGDGYYVELASDAYAGSFYTDASGNVYAPDNTLLVNSDDALAMTEGELSAKLYENWQGNQGAVRDSAAPPAGRPDSIPPAASQTKIPTIGDAASAFDRILKTAAGIVQTVRQIRAGGYTPPYSAYPAGIPRIQTVGVPVNQPNGSTITNNGNGTQTIRYPDGRTDVVQTSYTSAAGSGSLFGLSGNTLLIAGGLGLAALLIAKRKG